MNIRDDPAGPPVSDDPALDPEADRPGSDRWGPGSWYKSSSSAGATTCVEVRFLARLVQVRDSKQNLLFADRPDHQPHISLPVEVWPLVLAEAAGERPPNQWPLLAIAHGDGGSITLACAASGTELTYDADEWRAFVDGIRAGEFNPLATTG